MTQRTKAHGEGATRWTLDPEHTIVGFTAKHMMITTVRGRFRKVEGTLWFDESDPERARVEVEIDATSIDSGIEARDRHLRSADFLEVENHPVIVFRSRRVEGAPVNPGDRFEVIGDLTIRGTTREVTLEAVYKGRVADPEGERMGFSASARIDRRDFGLTWNQALETGGILVSNEIRIELETAAVAAAEAAAAA